MKLHVHPGPLPIAPPYLEWDEDDDNDDPIETEEEIDLTDLLEPPNEKRATGACLPGRNCQISAPN